MEKGKANIIYFDSEISRFSKVLDIEVGGWSTEAFSSVHIYRNFFEGFFLFLKQGIYLIDELLTI